MTGEDKERKLQNLGPTEKEKTKVMSCDKGKVHRRSRNGKKR